MNVAEEEVLFFYEVGTALRQWAAVEGQLRALVSMCVHPADGLAVAEGFMGIENFRSKLSFCDQLVRKRHARSAYLHNWERLHNNCRNQSAVRNRIAHGRHVLSADGAPGRRWGIVEWGIEVPVRVSKKGKATMVSTALCLSNVIAARQHFHRLTGELASLQSELRGFGALPPEFLGPEPDQTDLRDARNQIRRALGMPPLPSRGRPRVKDQP